MRWAVYICIVLGFTSCATLFNSKETKVNLHSKTPVRLVVEKDTLPGDSTSFSFYVPRKKENLNIKVFNDSTAKSYSVYSKDSKAYYLNIGLSFPWAIVGILVDYKNKKRYTYPKHLYLNINDSLNHVFDHDHYTTFKQIMQKEKYFHQLKITPFRFATDIRGLYLSYEYRYLKRHSTQITGAYIFDPFAKTPLTTWQNMYGYSLALEQKYFLKKTENAWTYASADFNYTDCKFTVIYPFQLKDPQDSVEYAHNHLDTISVKHRTKTFNLRYGAQYSYKRFVVDVNIGLGVRYREVKHLNKLHPDDIMDSPRHPVVAYGIIADGDYFMVNIPISLKIGYRF